MTEVIYRDKKLILKQNHAEFEMDTNLWSVKVDDKKYLFNDAEKIEIEEKDNSILFHFIKIVEGLSVNVQVKENDNCVTFSLHPVIDTFVFDEMVFPGVVESKNGKLVLPFQQGVLLDSAEKIAMRPSFGGVFGSADAYVNALGFYSDKQSYMWFVDDYYDSGYEIISGEYSEICMRSMSSLAHVSHTRVMRLFLFEGAFDYNEMAQLTRALWDEKGILTFKEKVERKPVLKQLIGSCVYHTGIHSKISSDSRYYHIDGENEAIVKIGEIAGKIKEFHKQGIERIHLHLDGCGIAYDNQHPRFYPIDERTGGYPALQKLHVQMHEAGDLLTIHDNYHDLYYDSPDFQEEYQIYDRKGNPFFMSVWAGGKQSYMTCQFAPGFLERNLKYLESQGVKSDGVYCDVFTCNPFDENFNVSYLMNRESCAKYRNDTFDVLNQKKMIVSSEEVNVYAINHIDTCHYAPYPFMMKQDGKQVGLPIPFFNLVFHDCLVIPWMSDVVNGVNYGLYGLLNGGIPYLKRDGAYVNTDGSFSQDCVDEQRIRMVKEICDFHKKVAFSKMVRHEFVDENCNIQQCEYENGACVRINLLKGTYEIH